MRYRNAEFTKDAGLGKAQVGIVDIVHVCSVNVAISGKLMQLRSKTLMNFFRKIKYWFNFAKRVWVSLGVGWGAVAIGFTPLISMDQAGALLICGVIVAEVFHDKRHRLFVNQCLPGVSTSYIYHEVEMIDGDKTHQGIEINTNQRSTGPSIVNADTWHLYHLATENEFSEFKSSRMWDLDRTMKRLESRVDYIIVFSAVIGTVLWAFAGQA